MQYDEKQEQKFEEFKQQILNYITKKVNTNRTELFYLFGQKGNHQILNDTIDELLNNHEIVGYNDRGKIIYMRLVKENPLTHIRDELYKKGEA